MSINFDLYTVEDKYINTGLWSPITLTYSPGPRPRVQHSLHHAPPPTHAMLQLANSSADTNTRHTYTLPGQNKEIIYLLDISTRGKRNVDGVLSPRLRGFEADTAARSATVNK